MTRSSESLVYLGVGLAIGMVVGYSLRDMNWDLGSLSEWQTLVTGILAVSAALFTVWQMQVTDIKQQDRHDELIRLTLRPDRARAFAVGRRVDPIRDLARRMPSKPLPNMKDPRPTTREFALLLEQWSKSVSDELSHPSIVTAAELFDQSTLDAFDEVARHIREAAPYINSNATGGSERLWREAADLEQLAVAHLQNAWFSLVEVADGLERLAKAYTALGTGMLTRRDLPPDHSKPEHM